MAYFLDWNCNTFQAVLGQWNRVEQRAALAAVGISSTVFALLGSFGLCSALGLHYGPMHSLIFCLLVGLSIDDMFVLVHTWQNQPQQPGVPLPERVGRTMRDAGVGITVTSATNIIVFLIGGTTVLPSLRSYSIFTGVGIVFTFFLQLTFFLAWFTIDQRRIESQRDGMCCWKRHPHHQPTNKPGLLKKVAAVVASFLRHKVVKAVILVASFALAGLCSWGVTQIAVELDYTAFLPSDSALFQWFQWDAELFPQEGEEGRVYMSGGLAHRLADIEALLQEFENKPEYIKSIDGWYPGFKEYVNKHFRPDHPLPTHPVEEEEFNKLLTQFLFSPSGSRYQPNFQFSSPLVCGQPAPPILVSSLGFVHPKLTGGPGASHLAAMRWVKDRVAKVPGEAFPMALAYSRWEVDEVVVEELLRNLLLALAMVTLVTLLLLADIRSCIFVLASVLLTIVDTVGLMYFWGLTINITGGTNLVISIGLCVDYSAHIAHTFLTQTGSRDERMVRCSIAVRQYGPKIKIFCLKS